LAIPLGHSLLGCFLYFDIYFKTRDS